MSFPIPNDCEKRLVPNLAALAEKRRKQFESDRIAIIEKHIEEYKKMKWYLKIIMWFKDIFGVKK